MPVPIYGRRRVGKTFLVRKHFKDQFDFYVTGIINWTFCYQMEAFNLALKQYGHIGPAAATWMQAFSMLTELLKSKNKHLNRRCVVFIDELPCFDTRNSGFIPDRKRSNIFTRPLALCRPSTCMDAPLLLEDYGVSQCGIIKKSG